MSKLRVAVITGGRSSERDISLVSAAGVMDHLDMAKYQTVMIDSASADDLIRMLQNPPDIAYIAQHGVGGEDGAIQGLLDILGIRYTGSGVLASALAMDKARCKEFLAVHGVRIARSVVARRGNACDAAELRRSCPKLVVKPNASGSSDGLSIIASGSDAELAGALDLAFRYDDTVLIEEFIEGMEITVGVLGNSFPDALPVVEIIPKKGVFDREAKYTPGAAEEICPARLTPQVAARAQEIAARCHSLLGCRGVSRADMIVAQGDPADIVMIEINTIPGMTPTSLLPLAAKESGLSYSDLLDKIIAYAMEGERA